MGLDSENSNLGFNTIENSELFITSNTREEIFKLESEINSLKEKYHKLKTQKTSNDAKTKKIEEEFDIKFNELKRKEELNYLLPRVNKSARELLETDQKFRERFENLNECNVVVISVDIRRSTDLMLKARSPKLFADFITILSRGLSEITKTNFGIFDKFTGDGILSFYPEFYSGEDSLYYAIKTAEECHDFFAAHYEKHRHCFNTVLKDIGLGIGIDYGISHLVRMGSEFTVVGTPVVYACRYSGAPAGLTLLNQPAFEIADKNY